MNRLKSKRLLALSALAVTTLGVAWATPPVGLTSVNLNNGPALLGEVDTKTITDAWKVEFRTKGESDVFVSHLTIAPGGEGGWHYHPGPSIISVKSGTARFYHDHAPDSAHIHPTGSAFVEEAYVVHNVRNLEATDLELVVVQIVPKGAPRRIDAPGP